MRPLVIMPTIQTTMLYSIQLRDRSYDTLDLMVLWIEANISENDYHIEIIYASPADTLPEGWLFAFNKQEDLVRFKLACL